MQPDSELSFASSLKSEQRKGFYEQNKPIAVLMILIVLLLPIVGVFVGGMSGAVMGLVISVSGYYLTPYAVLRLRAVSKRI
ncbi:MAG TPA: hypothetical protein VGJ57_02415 [Nitrospirales bacterium]|jgi:hypothetical protein